MVTVDVQEGRSSADHHQHCHKAVPPTCNASLGGWVTTLAADIQRAEIVEIAGILATGRTTVSCACYPNVSIIVACSGLGIFSISTESFPGPIVTLRTNIILAATQT